MPGTARKVIVTERQLALLQTLERSSSCPQGVARHAAIIRLAFEGLRNEEIAEQLGCERHQPGWWRRRWARAFDRLVVLECVEGEAVFRQAVIEVLSDAPRPGAPPKFTAEQVTAIIALACEPPEDSGRPVTHWTPTELADEAQKRGLVSSISPRQVGRFLKYGGTTAAPEPLLAECPGGQGAGVPAASGGGLRHLPAGAAALGGRGHAHAQHR
jgi:putative transposase